MEPFLRLASSMSTRMFFCSKHKVHARSKIMPRARARGHAARGHGGTRHGGTEHGARSTGHGAAQQWPVLSRYGVAWRVQPRHPWNILGNAHWKQVNLSCPQSSYQFFLRSICTTEGFLVLQMKIRITTLRSIITAGYSTDTEENAILLFQSLAKHKKQNTSRTTAYPREINVPVFRLTEQSTVQRNCFANCDFWKERRDFVLGRTQNLAQIFFSFFFFTNNSTLQYLRLWKLTHF